MAETKCSKWELTELIISGLLVLWKIMTVILTVFSKLYQIAYFFHIHCKLQSPWPILTQCNFCQVKAGELCFKLVMLYVPWVRVPVLCPCIIFKCEYLINIDHPLFLLIFDTVLKPFSVLAFDWLNLLTVKKMSNTLLIL